jgi:hypothetical protein
MTDETRLYVEMYLQSRGALLVHTVRPFDDVVADCARDGEPATVEQLRAAANEYGRLVGESILPIFWTDDARDDAEFVIRRARRHEEHVKAALDASRAWVGSPHPDVVIASAAFSRGVDPLPYSQFRADGTNVLTRAILRSTELRGRVAIVRAHIPSETAALIKALAPRRVVALSGAAEAALEHAGVHMDDRVSISAPYAPIDNPRLAQHILTGPDDDS